jgi:drug/metabolite transporter (DMT)-like permease
MNWTYAVWLQLLSFPVALTAGQILFKRSAQQVDLSGSWLFSLMRLPSMWVALALYGVATVLWVRILTIVPLSRAYPFTAAAFVLVPAAGYLLFDEPINARYAFGATLIIIGVIVAARA